VRRRDLRDSPIPSGEGPIRPIGGLGHRRGHRRRLRILASSRGTFPVTPQGRWAGSHRMRVSGVEVLAGFARLMSHPCTTTSFSPNPAAARARGQVRAPPPPPRLASCLPRVRTRPRLVPLPARCSGSASQPGPRRAGASPDGPGETRELGATCAAAQVIRHDRARRDGRYEIDYRV